MDCPVCKNVALVLADRQGIEIDYCPKCRGVWLDRGELDKLIERSSAGYDRAPHPSGHAGYDRARDSEPDSDRFGGRYHPSQRYDHRRKKGGLLGELFDFD